MSLPMPASLTPSKVATFKDCALAFRFSVIDRLPERPSVQAFKGTLVHRALQLLMWEEPEGRRTMASALARVDRAFLELSAGSEGSALGLEGDEREQFLEDARQLVRNYFELEDPNSVRVIGTELLVQADVDFDPDWAGAVGDAPATIRMRGIIDRLEIDGAGELVVTDYKTGRAPGESQEQGRLGGVHFYSFLCDRALGKRPARVQLLHLREPLAIAAVPSDQSVAGLVLQATAIWEAIRKACLFEDFRPKPGPVCDRCGFHAYCPAMGGDISLVDAARDEARAERLGVPVEELLLPFVAAS